MMTLREKQIRKIVLGDMASTVRQNGKAIWRGNQQGAASLIPSDLEVIRRIVAEESTLSTIEQIHDLGGEQRVAWIAFGDTKQHAWERHLQATGEFCRSLLGDPRIDARRLVNAIMADVEEMRKRLVEADGEERVPFGSAFLSH